MHTYMIVCVLAGAQILTHDAKKEHMSGPIDENEYHLDSSDEVSFGRATLEQYNPACTAVAQARA